MTATVKFPLFLTCVILSTAESLTSTSPLATPVTPTVKVSEKAKNITASIISAHEKVTGGNTSLAVVSSNEVSSTRFTSFLEDEELLMAGRESLRVLVKSLRDNKSMNEAVTVALTAFATSRTANRIKDKSAKSSRFSLDKDFDLTKSMSTVALGGLAVVPPFIFPTYFRSMDENWFNESRQIQKFITSSLVGVSESLMGWIEKSVDDLPSFPRLDAQECMKRSICEAHRDPKKYGLAGLVLQLFFPPYTETEKDPQVVSKYQLAARYGRQDNANCGAQFDGCVVNLLNAWNGIFSIFNLF